MNATMHWLAAGTTVGLLMIYETATAWRLRRGAAELARSAHAGLREAWFAAISQQPGSEILAVQTLRNSLMSATMTASTAALGLMGTLTLTGASLQENVDAAARGVPYVPAHLALELVLIGLLFASLVASAMAVRYYTHAGFICGIPVESPERQRWATQGAAYVRRAGLLYGWGLRQLVLVAPILAALLHPFAGPVAALGVIAVMVGFDRIAQS